jgi:nucleoside-diphosphate-sugar epimerase
MDDTDSPTDEGETVDSSTDEGGTVLLTGALGDVGSWVVDRLADHTHVVGVDVERPSGTRANADFRAVDLRKQGPTWETIQEVDPTKVVHLAAISDPLDNPGTRVFENNVRSTYNVLQAAGRHGVDVVWTSSQATYGALFAHSEWTPDYLPIDEDHDCRPEDAYGLSKLCCENVARATARQHGISVTTIRPASVFAPDKSRARPPQGSSDLSSDARAGNLGAYVDVRDVASLIEAALVDPPTGHETVLCVADENYLGRETAELVEAMCGGLPEECTLDGRESALSNAKARRLFDWEPEHEWGTEGPDPVDGPTWA